ncbi:hypothetical protein, variant 2 [Phytophthora nicotianae CJ01A1]|uniref:Glutaredoxin domain-containing protein n=6 Tax=Phytophthora nicotianae TaxID=4792 RepID=V9EHC0_PHYNI|nr:hypothetical protein, variant 1 [Phytophthora nicotianae INRA-310]XP_008911746.1 hypothetical protein, variant 2 [Phytophthora nicotianae INRA-310]ETI37451.1 hypothetical protein, variant 1 [Phytophthora nicotianae P1569]ETK77674.1 hypothetical protein, variant 1 [Phytophthora nicotianae]ETO66227.1 hypothetical protein, variant 1 [Phytophthora nicotianae P1976]ETP07312.1 hypothetical protein, variant 1 [Phytophthora nicotianae CJ01A1]ETP35385.1 hypothetical protein, variant 1 [Phytophthora
MSPVKTCVVLTSSMVSIAEQKYEIGHLKQLLDGNKITYTEVDCSLEENRDTRNRYFEVSGIRANYPQVFLQDPEGKDIQYIGSFKEIQVRQPQVCNASITRMALDSPLVCGFVVGTQRDERRATRDP